MKERRNTEGNEKINEESVAVLMSVRYTARYLSIETRYLNISVQKCKHNAGNSLTS